MLGFAILVILARKVGDSWAMRSASSLVKVKIIIDLMFGVIVVFGSAISYNYTICYRFLRRK